MDYIMLTSHLIFIIQQTSFKFWSHQYQNSNVLKPVHLVSTENLEIFLNFEGAHFRIKIHISCIRRSKIESRRRHCHCQAFRRPPSNETRNIGL